ncbi:MAG: hypothetical protein AB7K09_07700 [Planctomycetota bacterium]
MDASLIIALVTAAAGGAWTLATIAARVRQLEHAHQPAFAADTSNSLAQGSPRRRVAAAPTRPLAEPQQPVCVAFPRRSKYADAVSAALPLRGAGPWTIQAPAGGLQRNDAWAIEICDDDHFLSYNQATSKIMPAWVAGTALALRGVASRFSISYNARAGVLKIERRQ